MTKYLPLLVLGLLLPFSGLSNALTVSCGESNGYAYYFEGGLVGEELSGFQEDGISNGKFSLTVNDEGEADILAIDATGTIKSATSQGGNVALFSAGDGGFNWMVAYGDGTIEVYSYNVSSNSVAAYRNTVGNPNIAKNSLFVSDCD
jgi:hypothetical protein|tara:strand:+ start:126 stop:566 length:441 start_codon:yes stop_codon:yes gene_type:complete